MQEANELKDASELVEVEFPIMLTPTTPEPEVAVASRAYPTWAENTVSWETGF
jgi:hypothetical protein